MFLCQIVVISIIGAHNIVAGRFSGKLSDAETIPAHAVQVKVRVDRIGIFVSAPLAVESGRCAAVDPQILIRTALRIGNLVHVNIA